MKNHNGQVLVAFLLLLPLFLMALALIIDTGLLYIEKRKLNHVITDTIQYGLEKNITEENVLKNVIEKNIDADIVTQISIGENKMTLCAFYNKKSLLPSLFHKKSYEIKSCYLGIKENDTIKIVRE